MLLYDFHQSSGQFQIQGGVFRTSLGGIRHPEFGRVHRENRSQGNLASLSKDTLKLLQSEVPNQNQCWCHFIKIHGQKSAKTRPFFCEKQVPG